MRRFQLLGVGALLFAFATPSHATIISGEVTGGSAFDLGGTFVKLGVPLSNPFGPPNSVGFNNFQSPNLFGFDEDQNILLTAPLAVDVGSSPLPAGTVVASHYIFFDPQGTRTIVGTVEFDSDVLAIITSTARLNASDFLANTGVNYLEPNRRGLEPATDLVTISGPRQIRFDTTASSPGDYVRVLTAYSPAAVPEPGASAMLAGGGALLGAVTWLRRRTPSRRPSQAGPIADGLGA